MVLSIGTGLLGWGANALFYTNWASSVMHEEHDRGEWANRRERYRRWRLRLLASSTCLFFLGIVASAAFLFMRLYQ